MAVDVRGWYLRDTLARRTRQLLHGTELLPAGDGLHRTTQSTRQGSTLRPNLQPQSCRESCAKHEDQTGKLTCKSSEEI